MNARTVLYALLGVVASAAAVLSFAALRDLALVCGFASQLAWLLPIVIDAGAAAGSLVWLGGWTGNAARTFARALALALLALSVAANALGHGLEAFTLTPAWWVVVIVAAVAPAVLGSVVHLAVLVGRPEELPDGACAAIDNVTEQEEQKEPGAATDGTSAPLVQRPQAAWAPGADQGSDSAHPALSPFPVTPDGSDRAAALIATGAGRRRLSRELGVTEYEARRLLERTRPTPETPATDTRPANGATTEPAAPTADDALALAPSGALS